MPITPLNMAVAEANRHTLCERQVQTPATIDTSGGTKPTNAMFGKENATEGSCR